MEYDATPADDHLDDIEDDGKPLFEKHLSRRPESLYFEAVCNVRFYLRRYSICLVFFSCLPIFYSVVFCEPLELGIHDITLSNPMFNRYETNIECSSAKVSLRNAIIAITIYYGLKIYNKITFSLFYLLLLFYFGWEVRETRLKWSRNSIVITNHESWLNSIDLLIITIQTLSIFPFLVGGYFLLRHVYPKPTEAEIARNRAKYEEEERILKKQKREARDLANAENQEKKELEKQEEMERLKEEKEQKLLLRRRGRIENMEKNINAREQKRKEKEAEFRKLRAEKRKERRETTVAVDVDENEKDPVEDAGSSILTSQIQAIDE